MCHDQVLQVIADVVTKTIHRSEYHPDKHIKFLKPGEKHRSKPSTKTTWLSTAKDWQFKVDIGKQLKFPEQITKTSLRHDSFIFSNVTNKIMYEESQKRKSSKYNDLEFES